MENYAFLIHMISKNILMCKNKDIGREYQNMVKENEMNGKK